MIDTKALREAAEKATPGPWRYESQGYGFYRVTCGVRDYSIVDDKITEIYDARFISLANPQTILALLDVVEAAREAQQHDYITPELHDALAALDGTP